MDYYGQWDDLPDYTFSSEMKKVFRWSVEPVKRGVP